MGEARRRSLTRKVGNANELVSRNTRNGYSILGPAGTFHFDNVASDSEVVTIDGIGYINVTKALSLVPAHATPFTIPLDRQTIHHISLRDVDERVMQRMNQKRMDEPTLWVDIAGRKFLIDGVHRLNARIRQGLPNFRCFFLIEKALDHCRVRITREMPDGTRVPVEIDTDEFIAALKVAAAGKPLRG